MTSLFTPQGGVPLKETLGYAIAQTPTQDVGTVINSNWLQVPLILLSPHMGTHCRHSCHPACACRMPGTMLPALCEVLQCIPIK